MTSNQRLSVLPKNTPIVQTTLFVYKSGLKIYMQGNEVPKAPS